MTIGEAIDRIQVLLQDEDASAWSRDQVQRAMNAEITRLARQYLLGEILWLNAVGGQGRYALPAEMFMVDEVVYDGSSLRPATELSLRRVTERWEAGIDTRPAWFTQAQQPLSQDVDTRTVQTIEVVPAPVVTGLTIGPVPAVPLAMPLEVNLLAFGWVDPQGTTADETPLQVPEIVAQIAIYQAVAQLSAEDGDYRDKDKAMFFDQLATILTKALVS